MYNAPGNSFAFSVNGKLIFAKGSNWIPAHVLPEKVTDGEIQDLLFSAKEANMNMLRVWGGGIYESDRFYQLADQFGIMIWQDFMFACSMYPADDSTLESVIEEVTSQVRRLQSHPSIVIWAGNNENEAALTGNWYGTRPGFSNYKADYLKLYVDTVMPRVQSEDPSRTFLVSSPSNGVKNTEESGYINDNPYDPNYGDLHIYSYLVDGWDSSSYSIRPKFVSEYGWQSFSSFETLKPYSTEEDYALFSPWANHRQRHPKGNTELLYQVTSHLPYNTTMTSTPDKESFKRFIYLSQVTLVKSTSVVCLLLKPRMLHIFFMDLRCQNCFTSESKMPQPSKLV